MLRPVIMIGCGGSGQKAVRYIRDAVRRQLDHNNWEGGIPNAWQFIGLDTLNIQEAPGEIPLLPASDYKSVSLEFDTFTDLTNALPVGFAIVQCNGVRQPIDIILEQALQPEEMLDALTDRRALPVRQRGAGSPGSSTHFRSW